MSDVTLSYQALVSEDDIQRDAIKSLPISFDTYQSAIRQAIHDMGRVVENYLQRKLIVQKYTESVYYFHWRYDWGFNRTDTLLHDYPIVQIISVTDIHNEDITDEYSIHPETSKRETRIVGTDIKQVTVEYYAGYRRDDGESLSDIQNYSDNHGDLDTLPPVLPSEIRSVTTELVLHRLTLASNQQLGMGERITGIGLSDIKAAPPDRHFIEERLAMLAEHRRIH